MSTTAIILGAGATALSIVNIYFIVKLNKRTEKVLSDVGSHFSEIDIDNKINAMFQGSSTQTVDGLSKIVFNQLKDKYTIKARSYAELVDEIKLNPSISLELKQTLIKFYRDIIRISYQEEQVDEFEQQSIKGTIKDILKQLALE